MNNKDYFNISILQKVLFNRLVKLEEYVIDNHFGKL